MTDSSPVKRSAPSLSVIIPTLNAALSLPSCLAAVEAWQTPLEVIIVDGGSCDETISIAHNRGVRVLPTERGRGKQLQRGTAAAAGDWLLCIHSDSVLQNGWVKEVEQFIADVEHKQQAATFRFVLDDPSPQARRIERLVAWRCRALGLPYGDQGLLIHRDLCASIGGYKPMILMEDVDMVRRIGRANIHLFDTAIVTSAQRFRRDGWLLRPFRNLFCLFLYFCGVPPHWIVRLYG